MRMMFLNANHAIVQATIKDKIAKGEREDTANANLRNEHHRSFKPDVHHSLGLNAPEDVVVEKRTNPLPSVC